MASALLVSEIFPPAVGGSGVLLSNIYSRLRGIDVVAIADDAVEKRPAAGNSIRLVRMRVRASHWGVMNPRGLARHLVLAAAIRRHSRRQGCVVHCARALPEGVSALLSQLTMRGAPIVCWAHGEDIATALASRELTALMRAVYRNAGATIANSQNTARHVVHPGVDAARFAPGSAGESIRRRLAPEPGHVLLSVGRLQRRKGHDVAMAAMAALEGSHPDLRYVIVGDGEERRRLESLAAELGVSSRVVFAGEVTDEELPAYYAAADLFVMPNRRDGDDVEGFGIVFLEAAAAGVVAIGGRSGGVPEAIEDGVTGLLVEGTDAQELAAAIARLLDDAALRQRMGAAGRARVLEQFTWECAAERVEAIHRSVVRG
jgi:phosphatidylinositol alpha-1,6-mannosyltransferase